MWRVPSRGGEPRRLTQGTGRESDPSVSADGSRLAYSTGDPGSGAVFVDLDTGQQTTMGRMRSLLQASISPDGSRVVFVSERWNRRGELAEQLLDDGVPSGPRRLLTDGVDATRIRWDASTGTILAAATCGEERRSLWAVSPDTGEAELFEPVVVFGTERVYGLFDLSQEGRLLVFSRDDLAGDVWVSEGPPGLH